MPDIDITINPMVVTSQVTAEQVASVFAVTEKLISFGVAMTKMTSTTVDDKVVAFLSNLVAALKPYTQETWFLDLVNWILAFFAKPNVVRVVDAVNSALLPS